MALLACVPSADLASYSEGAGAAGASAAGAGGTGAGGAAQDDGGPPARPPSGGTSGAGGSAATGSSGGGASEPSTDTPDARPPERDGGAVSDPCEGGLFAPELGSCYFVAPAPASWLAAVSRCAEAGQSLVKITSADEDALIASLSDASLWIGASDVVVDNIFVWSDGSPILFGNWGPAQPDAFPGPDCVEKREEPGERWYDQPCSNEQIYVCERPRLTQ